MKPLHIKNNEPTNDLPEYDAIPRHDIFVPNYHKGHTRAQLTHMHGEHELLAFVVLTTVRLDSKLQLSLIIPSNKPNSINIVGTISNNESPEIVEPFIIPEEISPLRHNAFEKVAQVVTEAVKIAVDKYIHVSMDRRFKAYISQKFRLTIANLARDGDLRVISIMGIEDLLKIKGNT